MCYINLFHLDVYLVFYVRDIYVKTLNIGKSMNKFKIKEKYNETFKLFSKCLIINKKHRLESFVAKETSSKAATHRHISQE